MTKVELEAKVGALTDEINFLRNIYEEVRAPPSPGLAGVAKEVCGGQRHGGWTGWPSGFGLESHLGCLSWL